MKGSASDREMSRTATYEELHTAVRLTTRLRAAEAELNATIDTLESDLATCKVERDANAFEATGYSLKMAELEDALHDATRTSSTAAIGDGRDTPAADLAAAKETTKRPPDVRGANTPIQCVKL
jgi:hypothetical protein